MLFCFSLGSAALAHGPDFSHHPAVRRVNEDDAVRDTNVFKTLQTGIFGGRWRKIVQRYCDGELLLQDGIDPLHVWRAVQHVTKDGAPSLIEWDVEFCRALRFLRKAWPVAFDYLWDYLSEHQ